MRASMFKTWPIKCHGVPSRASLSSLNLARLTIGSSINLIAMNSPQVGTWVFFISPVVSSANHCAVLPVHHVQILWANQAVMTNVPMTVLRSRSSPVLIVLKMIRWSSSATGSTISIVSRWLVLKRTGQQCTHDRDLIAKVELWLCCDMAQVTLKG